LFTPAVPPGVQLVIERDTIEDVAKKTRREPTAEEKIAGELTRRPQAARRDLDRLDPG
jgi:hypothetical protein